MKTVVVTGGNGFLGQAIVRHFSAQGWHVIGVRRRHTANAPRFAKMLRRVGPELFVHAAGSASVARSFIDPVRDFADGPGLVLEMLKQLHRWSPRTRFLLLSSAAVYGNPVSLPVTEEHAQIPLSPYGVHKLRSESLCQEFAERFQLRTASVRIFSAYGPGLRRQVIWDICQKAMAAKSIVLQGSGAESRDFIHASDIARGIEAVAGGGRFVGEAYNLGSGRETPIADLAEQLLDYLDAGVRIRFDGVLPPGTPRNWRADIGKLKALGFEPCVSLDEGLAEYVSCFRAAERHRCPKSFALA